MRGPVHLILDKLREADAMRRPAHRRPEFGLQQLLDTKRAFDSVAADYDGPTGNNALIQAMRSPEVRERIAAQGFELWTSTPDEFAKIIRVDRDKWGKVVKASGAKVD